MKEIGRFTYYSTPFVAHEIMLCEHIHYKTLEEDMITPNGISQKVTVPQRHFDRNKRTAPGIGYLSLAPKTVDLYRFASVSMRGKSSV